MSTVLITGANRGLGLGLVRVYLEDGWNVIAVARKPLPELDDSAHERLEYHRCDLVDDSQLATLAQRLSDRTIDVLINNAARMAKEPGAGEADGAQGFGCFERAMWRDVFDINLFTPMHLSELLIDSIARSRRGRIVTISSMLGSMEMNDSGGLYAYRSSKAAVNAIMKSMAVDLGGRGVIAIALHPGWVRTDMGGPKAPLEIDASVRGMKAAIDGLCREDSGRFLGWDGSELPW